MVSWFAPGPQGKREIIGHDYSENPLTTALIAPYFPRTGELRTQPDNVCGPAVEPLMVQLF